MNFQDWLQHYTLFDGDSRILLMAAVAALCIGLSKSGLAGTATLNVVLMAQAFGAKASVGLVLPLLIVADMMGYWLNRHGGSWKRIIPMVPPAIVGVIIGYFLLGTIDNTAARTVIGWLIIALLGFKLWLDASKGTLQVTDQPPRLLLEHGLDRWHHHHDRECCGSGDDSLSTRSAAGEKGAPRRV